MTPAGGPCSCGVAEDHVVGRRRTADGYQVALWSDGALTLGFAHQYAIRGARGPARHVALSAGWSVLGDVELYDAAEVRDLAHQRRRAARRELRS